MQKTTTPSWFNRAPKNFGTVKHGKISADHWRSVCTVNLVITLVRLWGQAGASRRQKEHLESFLALVSVFRWAPTRSTSERQIQVVEHQLQKYYRSFMALSGKMTPSHHFSLHLPECLREFGPVHGWWGFAFERYNGIIQRQNSNNKLSRSKNYSLTSFTITFIFR